MKALVLAGGFGTRLKEVIHDRPKVMAPVNGKPFLEYLIMTLRKNGISEVVVSIGYLGDFIRNHFKDGKNFGTKITYCVEERPLGTGGAVKRAARFFDDTFLVLNGDTLCNVNYREIFDFHQKMKAAITICLVKRSNVKDVGLVEINKRGNIISFLEKSKEKGSGYVNAGLYFINPKIIRSSKWNGRFSLEKDFFPELAKINKLFGFVVKKDFLDVGTPLGYKKTQDVLFRRRQKVVEVKVPSRVSFVGGGTDLSSYSEKWGGCVISTTIDKYAHLRLKTQDIAEIKIVLRDYAQGVTYPLSQVLPYDNSIFDLYKAVINKIGLSTGVEIEAWGDFPAGSGLGTSSAFAVALIAALLTIKGERVSKSKLARLAVEIEREELKLPGGYQDQYAVSYGGFKLIKFLPGKKIKTFSFKLKPNVKDRLQGNLLIFYLGGRRSEKIQQEFLSKNIKKSVRTIKFLHAIKDLVLQAGKLLKKGEIDKFGAILHEVWMLKKMTSLKITTILVDEIYNLARKEGALGGKLLGAGGGGCFLFYVPKKYQKKVRKVLEEKGAVLIPFSFEPSGVKVVSYED